MQISGWILNPQNDWPYCDFKLHLLTELECLYELKQIWISAGGRVDSVVNSSLTGKAWEC